MQGFRIVQPLGSPKVHPGDSREESGQHAFLGEGGAGKEHGDHPEFRLSHPSTQGAAQFFVRPRPTAAGSDHDRASARGVERLLDRLLPRPTRHELPAIEPWAEAGGISESAGEHFDRGVVLAAVRQENVEDVARFGHWALPRLVPWPWARITAAPRGAPTGETGNTAPRPQAPGGCRPT